jgi:hypothetical protein
VTSISVGIHVTGPLPFDGTGPIDVVITQDSGGLPGNPVATIPATANTFGDQLFTVSVPGLVPLDANTTYWVALEPGGSFDGSWRFNGTSASGPMAGRANLGAWSLQSGQPNNFAFEVEGRLISSVPEPASALLLGMGVLAVLGYGRLRRRGA